MTSPIFITGIHPTRNPDSAARLFVVSTDPGDGQAITLSGLSSGTATSESLALGTGRIEKVTSHSYTTLDSASADISGGDLTGTVHLYAEGTTAIGYIIGLTNPADGDTLDIGLTGVTQTYTFRNGTLTTIQCLDASGFVTGVYFDILDPAGVTHRFWYNIDGGGGAPSTPLGGILVEIDVASSDTADIVAGDTASAITSELTSQYVTADNAGTDTVTITKMAFGTQHCTDGGTGFTIDELYTHADAAGIVLIGTTVTDTMTNLAAAINHTGASGVQWGTATPLNPYVTGSVSGVNLTLTDTLGCDRALGWDCAASVPANFVIFNPVNGGNGPLLATLASGSTDAFNSLSFDNETLAILNLPGLLTPTSDPLRIGGGTFTLEAALASAADHSVNWNYETSTNDGATWRPSHTSDQTLSPGDFQRVTVTDHAEMMRVKITSNANTAARALHLKAVF